jgi:nitroreductase
MDFSELILRRYSVRAYKPDPVPTNLLNVVLEAARMAPTAANRQPFRLIVLKTAGRQSELKRIYYRDWFGQAPLVICICAVPAEAWVRRDGKNYADVDVSIAMDHLVLSAANVGLGTCWVAAFDPATAREILCLPEDVEPIAFTPLGYPADQLCAKERRPLAELVHYERWPHAQRP